MSKAELLKRAMQAKSDQLNADDLIGSPITITITDVTINEGGEQKVAVHYQGENGRPFKPCKTMMRVMSFGLGDDPDSWVGHSLTLYNDQSVVYAGEKVGGIRISHMSGITKPIELAIQKSKGKKQQYKVLPLQTNQKPQQAQQQATQPLSQDEIERFIGIQRDALEDAAMVSMDEFARVWAGTKNKKELLAFKDQLKEKYFSAQPDQPKQSGRDPNELLSEINAERNGVENF